MSREQSLSAQRDYVRRRRSCEPLEQADRRRTANRSRSHRRRKDEPFRRSLLLLLLLLLLALQ